MLYLLQVSQIFKLFFIFFEVKVKQVFQIVLATGVLIFATVLFFFSKPRMSDCEIDRLFCIVLVLNDGW